MASTVIKSVRAKTLPEIRRDESVDVFHNWLRAIPCERHAFEFANELLCKQYRDVIARVMRLKNLEQDCWTEAEKQSASNYYSAGIGIVDSGEWQQTVDISLNSPNLEGATVITSAPPAEAYTNQFAETANAELNNMGLDTTGEGFSPIEVTLNEGGE